MTKRDVISCGLALFFLLIVAVILYPTFGTVMVNPHGNTASFNLQQIANAYSTYSHDPNHPRSLQLPPGSTAHDAAFILAKYVGLNDASVWFTYMDDSLANITLPRSVVAGNISTATGPSPNFASIPLSIVVAANVSTDAPATTTPIAWTRGLQSDGTWSADSPWLGQGGHIAFLDGHVEWFDKLNAADPTASLVIAPGWPDAGNLTANITEALPPGAVILSAEPRHNAK